MAADVKGKVLNHIKRNREEVVEFLQKLISIPSVSGDEKDIQEFIAEKLRNMGLSLDVWEPDIDELKRHPGYVPAAGNYQNRPNVVGIQKGEVDGKSLLFNGHVDVIPQDRLMHGHITRGAAKSKEAESMDAVPPT